MKPEQLKELIDDALIDQIEKLGAERDEAQTRAKTQACIAQAASARGEDAERRVEVLSAKRSEEKAAREAAENKLRKIAAEAIEEHHRVLELREQIELWLHRACKVKDAYWESEFRRFLLSEGEEEEEYEESQDPREMGWVGDNGLP